MCDVVSTQKIFVEMQGIRGSEFKSRNSKILFGFPNELIFGFLEPTTLKFDDRTVAR